jgi:HEAT repeat protein
MSQVSSPEPLAPAVAARLTEFARACKAATRAVSLYPADHPAITASLARLVDVTRRAVQAGPLTIAVLPSALLVDQRAPARPDPAVGELAALLHDHLVGELRIASPGDPQSWRAFLLLVGQAPADMQAQGGIARAWTATGGHHLSVREVDYAEVLRLRDAGMAAAWDTIIQHCLQGDATDLDDETLAMLLQIADDPERLAELASQLDRQARDVGSVRLRAEALLRLLRHIADGAARTAPDRVEAVLSNIAASAGRLSPELMVELLGHRHEDVAGSAVDVVDAMVTRMTDGTVSQFVAHSIVEGGGATERLAQAFQTLVPDGERRQRVLGLAHEDVAATPLGQDASFPDLWQRATDMLTSYRDETFVSQEYARELSDARTHAEELDRIADDPPERIAQWLSSTTDPAVRALDLVLLLDLLRLEQDAVRWRELMDPVVAHVNDLVLLGDVEAALPLVAALVREAGPDGRDGNRAAAATALERLRSGHLMQHMVGHLRTIDDAGFDHVRALCLALGPVVIKPLAEALSSEERGRAFRRLTDLLVGFGSAGRDAAEQLMQSANPAVRRTAIYLLREFGGNDALAELASMLDDTEQNVQREAVRAIAMIGTDEAYTVLHDALSTGTPRQREAIVGALGSLRDERALPLFCHMVKSDQYRRTMLGAYQAAVEGLGAVGGPEAVTALSEAMYRGQWWAPFRTAAIRRSLAAALRRIGSPDAIEALRRAAGNGPRGARTAAREQLARGGVIPGREA